MDGRNNLFDWSNRNAAEEVAAGACRCVVQDITRSVDRKLIIIAWFSGRTKERVGSGTGQHKYAGLITEYGFDLICGEAQLIDAHRVQVSI